MRGRNVTNLQTRANRAGHAQVAHKLATVGYYVVNARTRIPVDGPFQNVEVAERECRDRNAEESRAPDALVVEMLG